jgi:hypothetical protein
MKIFDYNLNSEIWGVYANNDFIKWDKTSTEKSHLKFSKIYLGVNRKASMKTLQNSHFIPHLRKVIT